jgi:hypothetical protein
LILADSTIILKLFDYERFSLFPADVHNIYASRFSPFQWRIYRRDYFVRLRGNSVAFCAEKDLAQDLPCKFALHETFGGLTLSESTKTFLKERRKL